VLGYVAPGPSRLVRVAVTQDDMGLIRERSTGVQVRLAHTPERIHAARVLRQVPGGEFELVSAALGTSGGGEIAVDPSVPQGRRSLARVFDVEVAMDEASPVAAFGDRAWVRFDLGAAPLAWQGFVRVRQLFLARLNV
jgi:putative peptide zinc metalloprotease protein